MWMQGETRMKAAAEPSRFDLIFTKNTWTWMKESVMNGPQKEQQLSILVMKALQGSEYQEEAYKSKQGKTMLRQFALYSRHHFLWYG